jgi:hypothetical protein
MDHVLFVHAQPTCSFPGVNNSAPSDPECYTEAHDTFSKVSTCSPGAASNTDWVGAISAGANQPFRSQTGPAVQRKSSNPRQDCKTSGPNSIEHPVLNGLHHDFTRARSVRQPAVALFAEHTTGQLSFRPLSCHRRRRLDHWMFISACKSWRCRWRSHS